MCRSERELNTILSNIGFAEGINADPRSLELDCGSISIDQILFCFSFPVSYWIKNQKVLRKIPGAKWRREQPGTQLAEWIMYSSSKQNKKTKWPKTRKTKMKSTNTLNSWTGFLTLQFLPVKIKNTNKKKIEIFNSKKKFKNYFFCLYLCIPLFVLFCYHNCSQLRCLTLPAVCFIVQLLSLYQCQGFSV